MEEEALRSIEPIAHHAREPIAHHARELSTVAVLQFFNNASSTLSPTFPPENPKGEKYICMCVRVQLKKEYVELKVHEYL